MDFLTATPEAFGSWLLQNRFQNDEVAATTFLLEAVSSFPNADATAEAITGGCGDDEGPAIDLGKSLTENEVSSSTPRGKMIFYCFEKGIRLTGKSNGDSCTFSTAKYILVFPEARDCQPSKKLSSDLVLIVFDEAVPFKNKSLNQVCFSLPLEEPPSSANDEEGLTHSDKWITVLCASLGFDIRKVARVSNPSKQETAFWRYTFVSQEDEYSTTTGGMPFVKAYHGTNDGAVYPLREGILFYKPPLFIPRESMSSISCGRNQDASSRYVDLVVTKDDDTTVEFSNIHRSELSVLRQYIHEELIPAMQKDAGLPDTKAVPAEVENYEPNDRRGKRKASVEAREMNRRTKVESSEDDDEDEDFDEDSGSSESETESENEEN